jgi:MOSC domain-containing protein YiiM
MAVPKWAKLFTAAGETGTYLRVLTPGAVHVGDTIEVLERPDHGVTIGTYFRAVTTERHRLPELLAAKEYLPAELLEEIEHAER